MTNSQFISIAIDGPAGAGKSTIAKEIARTHNFLYINTGELYRSLALACKIKNIDPNNEEALNILINYLDLEFHIANNELKITLDKKLISPFLHDPEISKITPIIAKYPQIRKHFQKIQRELAINNNIVMEGRDITSVVLPNATHKFYITASAETRAKRRFDQLVLKSRIEETPLNISYDEILESIKARDYQDSQREHSPLKINKKAILIDTSDLNLEESINLVNSYLAPSAEIIK